MSESREHTPKLDQAAFEEKKADTRPTAEPSHRNGDVWRAQKSAGAERSPPMERTAGSAKDSWERPGTFHVERDSQGRTNRIEGWLSGPDSGRPPSENAVQQEVRKRDRLTAAQDAGHIIGVACGGPCAETHGNELARANVTAMDSRVNRSLIEGLDRQTRADLAAGKKIYVEASVNYGASGHAESVTCNYFERAPDGTRRPCAIAGATTRLDIRPSQTASEAVHAAAAGTSSDFYKPGRAGTAPGVH